MAVCCLPGSALSQNRCRRMAEDSLRHRSVSVLVLFRFHHRSLRRDPRYHTRSAPGRARGSQARQTELNFQHDYYMRDKPVFDKYNIHPHTHIVEQRTRNTRTHKHARTQP